MSDRLPDQISDALSSLVIPDSNKNSGGQLARIRRLQIAHKLDSEREQHHWAESVLWSSPPGSVAVHYALIVASRFLVRVMYESDNIHELERQYNPKLITRAYGFGTRLDLAVAEHIFNFFRTQSECEWQKYAAARPASLCLEHEIQFIYGLWTGITPEELTKDHLTIGWFVKQLGDECARRYSFPRGRDPHEAVSLSLESAFVYSDGDQAHVNLNPTVPSVLQGGTR